MLIVGPAVDDGPVVEAVVAAVTDGPMGSTPDTLDDAVACETAVGRDVKESDGAPSGADGAVVCVGSVGSVGSVDCVGCGGAIAAAIDASGCSSIGVAYVEPGGVSCVSATDVSTCGLVFGSSAVGDGDAACCGSAIVGLSLIRKCSSTTSAEEWVGEERETSGVKRCEWSRNQCEVEVKLDGVDAPRVGGFRDPARPRSTAWSSWYNIPQ